MALQFPGVFCLSRLWALFCGICLSSASSSPFFGIRVVDSASGRGVPLVLLRTVNYITHWTDSLGYVAFFEPGMMDQPVFFGVLSDGYQFDSERHLQLRSTDRAATIAHTAEEDAATDPFDAGLILHTTTNGSAVVYVKRTQLAERAYRLTGGGLYRDSVLLGLPAPVPSPLLDRSGVVEQDTLMASHRPYRGRRYIFFGDSACPRSRRQDNCDGTGMYSVGATTCEPSTEGCSTKGDTPPVLDYFISTEASGFSHPLPMAPMEPLDRNTWIACILATRPTPHPSAHGDITMTNQTMYAVFMKPAPNTSETDITGVLKWSDEQSQFQLVTYWPLKNFVATTNFATAARGVQRFAPSSSKLPSESDPSAPSDDDGYFYLTMSFVYMRVPEHQLANLSAYEAFTPLLANSSLEQPVLDPAGWGWKQGAVPVLQSDEAKLIALGVLPPSEAHFQVRDVTSGHTLGVGIGTVNYNEALGQYLLITEYSSTDRRGAIFAGVSSSLTGPWTYVTPVLSHDVTGASCYNPLHMPWMDEEGGRFIYVACSYTAMWSDKNNPNSQWYTCLTGVDSYQNCATPVPRYEYNNMVYRLDVTLLKSALQPKT